MQYHVAPLLKGPSGVSHSYTLDEHVYPLEDTEADRVWGHIKLTRTDKGVWVSGSLKSTAAFICSRCLEASSTTVQFPLEETFYPSVDIQTGAPLSLPEDTEPGCVIDPHHILDITEVVRQGIVAATPMKPLCRAECAGLCPECGTNWNTTPCACRSTGQDPRWSLLRQASGHTT